MKKLVVTLPVTDETLEDSRGIARFWRRFMIRCELSRIDRARLDAEDALGRALALRTPRYMPALALIYVASRTPFARGFAHAVVGLGGALAFSLALLAAYFVLVMTLPR